MAISTRSASASQCAPCGEEVSGVWFGEREGEWRANHHDDALDAVRESFVAALLPVVGRFRLLAQHHGRAVREEVDGREVVGRHIDR